jgi:fumarate reductase flavoprotein subunit
VAPRLVSAMYRGAIIVNRAGRRFVNESVSYKTIGDRCLEQPELLGFQVFDQRVMDQSSPLPTVADYKGALDAGLVKQADSLEALAAALGIDAAALRETVDAYNRACGRCRARCLRPHLAEHRLRQAHARGDRAVLRPGLHHRTDLDLLRPAHRRRCARARRLQAADRGPLCDGRGDGRLPWRDLHERLLAGQGCIFGRLAAQHAVARAVA